MNKEVKYYRADQSEGEDPRLKEFKLFLQNLTNEKVEAKITDAEYEAYIKKYDDIIKSYKTK